MRILVPRFNPRTRVGCDGLDIVGLIREHGFQSTHPRGVRHNRLGLWAFWSWVSIHAPAWGATGLDIVGLIREYSFNPRTRVGCDQATGPQATGIATFQSTHPRGVRPQSAVARSSASGVSIHAPAWGATGLDIVRFIREHGFNPRTRVGCDSSAASSKTAAARFNPRTRVGCDVLHASRSSRVVCFNPRTRVGCDQRRPSSWLPQ